MSPGQLREHLVVHGYNTQKKNPPRTSGVQWSQQNLVYLPS